MTATSLRLPAELKREAVGYASGVGISINALVAVALREYLDRRPTRDPGLPAAPNLTPLSEALVTPAGGGNRKSRRSKKPKR